MTQSKQEVITQKNKTQFIKLINKINELENDLSILYIELIEVEDNIIKRMNKKYNITFYKENIPVEEL